ncbi:metal ABC transporter permease [Magnetovibrio sp. PR-2]|uniref:metal ABC transporter permease n=1 Tax=Magnetovibrio sp. PR-2 TaxID=3120356 RepID=UPI002FCE2A7F
MSDWGMDDFLIRAALAGVAVALVAGPLGAFVVWRRMAYFGGALSHTALLGVALGFLLGLEPAVGVVCVVVVMALMLGRVQRIHGISLDTLLGVVAHAGLALGLIIASTLDSVRIDLMGYLFGDILAVGWADVVWVWGTSILILVALSKVWHGLLNATVHADLAQVEGTNVRLMDTVFMVILALVVALAMQVVGILLVTAMLIIPASSVRRIAKTPEGMAIYSVIVGVIAVCAGLWGSYEWDTPAGPSIVMASTVMFLLGQIKLRRG